MLTLWVSRVVIVEEGNYEYGMGEVKKESVGWIEIGGTGTNS